MKKILLYSTLALGVGLCSCSQEDLGESPAQAVGQPVTVSVQLPGEVGNDGLSRAVPAIPADHKLRCILLVSDSDDSTEDIRQEVIAENANDNITFTFIPPADTYTCSFWADYIDEGAESTNGLYADKYYDTQSLPNVTFAESATLFNNEACDAFTGHFDQAQIASGSTITLSRPLAKVNFVAKEEVSGNVSVTSGYEVSNGMNISTGVINTAGSQKNLTYNGNVADATEKVLFYNYLFADGTSTKLPASIFYTLDDKGGTISTRELTLNPNTPYNLSFSTASGEVASAPRVGDYFFTDGTWSSTLDDATNKTVAGVVFAVKGDGTDSAIEGDVIDNYSDANGATDVLAWVVAAKDAGSGKYFYTGSAAKLPFGLGTDGADDIKGYTNTGLWYTQSNTEYEAVATAKAYDVTITGETPNSDWYLPAAGQLMALVKVYAENNSNAQGNALAVKNSLQLIESEQTDETALMKSGYYWTSSGSMSNELVAAYRVGFHEKVNYGKNGVNTNLKSGSYIRPVLTIFKSAN